jgi:hypothetical protein
VEEVVEERSEMEEAMKMQAEEMMTGYNVR